MDIGGEKHERPAGSPVFWSLGRGATGTYCTPGLMAGLGKLELTLNKLRENTQGKLFTIVSV